MVDAVIASTARTAIGRAYRGALSNTEGATLAGRVIGEAVHAASALSVAQLRSPEFKEAATAFAPKRARKFD